MRSRAEIVIIGGGVVGASVAYHLAKRGCKDILILERERAQGLGSTGKATGGVRAQFETNINIRMSMYSIEFFRNCEFECGYEPAGYLFFATDERQLEYLKANVESQVRLGIKDVSIVDHETVGDMVPGMNCDDITGGSFGGRDGFIDPLAVMRGFTESAIEHGAKIEFGSSVLSVEEAGGRVRSVTTTDGIIECDAAVLCTGPWVAELAAATSINLPVVPIRRQIVWARTRNRLPERLPMVIDIGTGFHFRPARDFNMGASTVLPQGACRDVLFAYPDPQEKPSWNTEFDDGIIEKVFNRARHRASFLVDSVVVNEKCRAGLYEVTPDHHAVIGGCDIAGLYLAGGFSGHGVMHSPATGRALSEIILDGTSKFLDVDCLHIDRFKTGKLLHETAFI